MLEGLGLRVQGLRFGVQGLGLGVHMSHVQRHAVKDWILE